MPWHLGWFFLADLELQEKRKPEPREPKERKPPVKRKAGVKTNGSAKSVLHMSTEVSYAHPFPRRPRPGKKWNSDDEDEDEEISGSASSDPEAATAVEPSASSSDHENVVSARQKKLGRGAGTRAKVCTTGCLTVWS